MILYEYMVSGLLHDCIIISIHVQVHHPPVGHAPRRDLGEQKHLYLLHGAGARAGRALRRFHAPRPHAPLGQHVPQRRQPHTAHEAQVPLPGQHFSVMCYYACTCYALDLSTVHLDDILLP